MGFEVILPLLTRGDGPADSLPSRLAVFGLLYCALHVGTIFLKTTFSPGLTLGDWISLLIPWAVMGAAFLVWDATSGDTSAPVGARRLLLASALLYATGYGINLSANAIGRLMNETARVQPALLTYFLDEHLGHILWHSGMLGTTAALVLAARRLPAARLGAMPIIGALAYSFAWFTEAVEGQTVPLLLPASLLFVTVLGWGRLPGARSVIGRFVLLAHLSALVMFAIWRVWQGGMPQFSDVWGI